MKAVCPVRSQAVTGATWCATTGTMTRGEVSVAGEGMTRPLEVAPFVVQDVTTKGSTGQAMSCKSIEELSVFISTSVLPQTIKVYEKNWQLWVEFVNLETGGEDPFMYE